MNCQLDTWHKNKVGVFFTNVAFKANEPLQMEGTFSQRTLKWTCQLCVVNYMHVCILCFKGICRYRDSKNGLQGRGRKRISVLEYNLHFIQVNSNLHFGLKKSCILHKISYRYQSVSTCTCHSWLLSPS